MENNKICYSNPCTLNILKKFILLFSIFGGGWISCIYSQKVGIGTNMPTERLHVAGGNFRLDGAFKPNNDAGIVGQILQSQGPNNPPKWVNASGGSNNNGIYKYIARWTPNGTTLGTGLIQDDSIQVHITMDSNALPTNNLNNFFSVTAPGFGNNQLNQRRIAIRGTSTDSSSIVGISTGINGGGNNPLPSSNLSSRISGAVMGLLNASGTGAGVSGYSSSSTNYSRGVFGMNTSKTTVNFGVQGNTISEADQPVNGTNFITSAGIFGSATNTTGMAHGVQGWASNNGISSAGVFGYCNTRDQFGVLGENPNQGVAVYGFSTDQDAGSEGIGVQGRTDGGANFSMGVYGLASSPGIPGTGKTYGVMGWSLSEQDSAAGVFGLAKPAGGILGKCSFGVMGKSYGASDSSAGVIGINNGSRQIGVYGRTSGGNGVYGLHYASTGSAAGVQGETRSRDAGSAGVKGLAASTSGMVYGIRGQIQSNGANSAGVRGDTLDGAPEGTTFAIWGQGSIKSTGKIIGAQKLFQIDHPLEPETKYLQHVCPESDIPLNIYTGKVKTNSEGIAEVKLPSYVSIINRDFTYQFTCMNSFSRVTVSKEISGNIFEIKTEEPNIVVYWVIYGIRNDAYSKAHPFEAEVQKEPENIGKYLHPVEMGKKPETGIGYLENQKNTSSTEQSIKQDKSFEHFVNKENQKIKQSLRTKKEE